MLPRDTPDTNQPDHVLSSRLTAQSRRHVSSPACDPATSSDADVQGLLAKILTAALGPGVIHQMFTCTDRCLCWSS